MLNRISISTHSQLPLIHVVNKDDELLSNNCDAQWYSILKNFPWENYRELGASYYNALYDFNISKQLKEEDPKENKRQKMRVVKDFYLTEQQWTNQNPRYMR